MCGIYKTRDMHSYVELIRRFTVARTCTSNFENHCCTGWHPQFKRTSGNPTVRPSARGGLALERVGSSQSRGCKCCFVYDQPRNPPHLGRPPPAPSPREPWRISGVKQPRTHTHSSSLSPFSLLFLLSLSLSSSSLLLSLSLSLRFSTISR